MCVGGVWVGGDVVCRWAVACESGVCMVCVGGGGVDVRMLVAMDVGEGVMLVMRWRRWWWWRGGGEVVVKWWWRWVVVGMVGGGKVVGVCAVVVWCWWCVRVRVCLVCVCEYGAWCGV